MPLRQSKLSRTARGIPVLIVQGYQSLLGVVVLPWLLLSLRSFSPSLEVTAIQSPSVRFLWHARAQYLLEQVASTDAEKRALVNRLLGRLKWLIELNLEKGLAQNECYIS